MTTTEPAGGYHCPHPGCGFRAGRGQARAGDAFANLNVAERGALIAICREIVHDLSEERQ